MVLGLVLASACGNDPRVDPSIAQPQGPIARDAQIATTDGAPVRFVGVLAAEGAVEIAPRVGGVLAKVNVRPGDVVKQGDIVAEMDPSELRDQLRAAEAAQATTSAAVRRADVDVREAEDTVKRETDAYKQGISSRAVLDAAIADLERKKQSASAARSTRDAAAVQVQIVRDQVADTGLRAPFDGTVAERYRDPGNRVELGGRILKIVGAGNMRLRFAVPLEHARKLAVGSRVTATIETIATPISATVKQVPPSQDPASGMVFVEAELDGARSAELRHGLAAWVKPAT